MFKKTVIVSLLLLSTLLIHPEKVLAVCPVCTVAVCAGVGLSRYFGVDDTISGVWIGGLIVSMIAWTINFLNQKKIRFKFRKITVAVLYYLLMIIPLYQFKIIGHPLNKYKLFGLDKLLIGIISGSLVFVMAVLVNDFLKKKNNGKALFPFQKVVIPILFLGINSLIFYYLSCR